MLRAVAERWHCPALGLGAAAFTNALNSGLPTHLLCVSSCSCVVSVHARSSRMVGSCLSCWRQRCWAYLRGAEGLLLIAVVAETSLPPAELWRMNSEGFPVLLCGDGMCAEVLSAEMLGEMRSIWLLGLL